MTPRRTTERTQLIELEDDLLEQYDTCQWLLATVWQTIRSSDERLHLPTLRRILAAIRDVVGSVDGDLFEVRFQFI
ncbi:hypothetical protein [Cohnella fermenti]|uniref:Uncharacterized protein n=1 Tax=Cohnella fermenti TaxID=2565925 RepID=A0A4S4C319_9BACL|nr:hypothetical protein [Cohnella fermenti]THF82106.1 hypothetical protein E6C55_06890 [Cohnella fermenti]